MTELSHRLETKSIHFTTDIDSVMVLTNVNHDLIFQLFYNLINNAIRYNKQDGSIHIEAKENCVTVVDTGIGIREQDLTVIFNRFKKAGNREGEGYGLGLSIVKSIASYHNAAIDVHSAEGKGTQFHVRFNMEN